MSFLVANLKPKKYGMQYDIRIFLDKEGILHILAGCSSGKFKAENYANRLLFPDLLIS